MPTKTILAVAAGGLFTIASCLPAFAQDATAAATNAPKLNVELNALVPSQKGCVMTFVAENDLATPIGKISFELAFFNDKNAVDRVTILDFRDLPVGKKRVRQFDMPGVKCESVSRIIINDTPVCEGPTVGECKAALTTRSQLSVFFEG